MAELQVNTLTAFFGGLEDIRHDMAFVIHDSGALQPGTHIVADHPAAEGSFLEVILDKGQGIWMAEWHDRTGNSPHGGKLFHIILMPPIDYQDEVPVRRNFKVELVGDHELSSPPSA